MEKEFILYEQALELKELGFDEPCLGLFKFANLSLEYPYLTNTGLSNSNLDKYCSAPLYQQAFRWFREKHDMCSFIQRFEGRVYDYEITSDIFKEITDFKDGYFDTYEEAELECLKKLIEIVKEK
jgi:hypothetical protein